MKKTQTVNIGGFVFHVDEDAYKRLSKYLKEIEDYFSREPESEEIMADIEMRVAELLKERMGNSREVVRLVDVEYIESVMGNPSQFANEEEAQGNEQASSAGSRYRRMYRDPDNRVLGGVCSGLGAYWGIDPVIPRVIFVIVFLTAGIGLLVYLILWIVMPEAKTTAQKLEMKGEPVNFSNIGKTVKDEFEKVKKNVKSKL